MVVLGLILVIVMLLVMLYIFMEKLYSETKDNAKNNIKLSQDKLLYAESHVDLNTILCAVDESNMTSNDEEYDYDNIRKLLLVIENVNSKYEIIE